MALSLLCEPPFFCMRTQYMNVWMDGWMDGMSNRNAFMSKINVPACRYTKKKDNKLLCDVPQLRQSRSLPFAAGGSSSLTLSPVCARYSNYGCHNIVLFERRASSGTRCRVSIERNDSRRYVYTAAETASSSSSKGNNITREIYKVLHISLTTIRVRHGLTYMCTSARSFCRQNYLNSTWVDDATTSLRCWGRTNCAVCHSMMRT